MDKHYYEIKSIKGNTWTIDEISYYGQPLNMVIRFGEGYLVLIHNEYYKALCEGIRQILDEALSLENCEKL